MPELNALGYPKTPIKPSILDDNKYIQLETEFDKETGSTRPVEKALDFQKLIESYADMAGVEYMIKQVKLGAVSLSDLADDGKHGFDVSAAPGDVNDAYQKALYAGSELDKLGKALDLDLGSLDHEAAEKAITDKIAAIYEARNKQVEVKNDAE